MSYGTVLATIYGIILLFAVIRSVRSARKRKSKNSNIDSSLSNIDYGAPYRDYHSTDNLLSDHNSASEDCAIDGSFDGGDCGGDD